MRLPALAIALEFASGIAIALWLAVSGFAGSPSLPRYALAASFFLLVLGFLFVRQRPQVSAVLSFAVWLLLGAAGTTIAHQPKPDSYVLRLVDSGAVDLHTPLRWHGTMRDEPTTLPRGVALNIELTSVDFQERTLPATGGLRVGYSLRSEGDAPLPEVRTSDEVTVVAQARLPQVFRDEGAFDRRAYLREQGVDLTATLRAPELLERVSAAPNSPLTWLARTRHRLREELSGLLPDAPEEAAVLRAMLLGDRSFLDRSESANFQKTGVFHVLVLAGLHVGAFAAFLFWLARRFRFSRFWTSLAVLLCIAAYVAVVEQRPPVLRAALMTLIVILATLFFRRVELLNSVAIAALILLVASPALLTDSSFLLSFLAMFCIAGIAAPWLERSVEPYARGMRGWRDVTRDVSHEPRIAQFRIDLRALATWLESKLPAPLAKRVTNSGAWLLSIFFRLAEMVALTLVLQFGMLPLMARDFHRVTLSGPIANLLAVPLTGVLVPLGFATLLAGWFVPAAGALLGIPLRWLTSLLLHVVAWVAHFPRWSYRIPAPPLWLVLLFFAAAILLMFALRTATIASLWVRRGALVSAGVLAFLIATYPFAPQWRKGSLELNVLDVGQGDSLFLVSPAGHTILVDAAGPFSEIFGQGETRGPDSGPNPGEDAVSPYLWSRGFQQLDVVALTHAHQDHIGGLPAIFENFHVKALWIGREVALEQQKKLELLAASHGVVVVHELRGAHLEWDNATLDFLWPQIVPEEVASSAKNDDSLVFRVSYGERHLLLPGDAEKSSEHAILSETEPEALRAEVLKVGHHGSRNSTIPEFLETVHPSLAVISAGEENPYGHPSPALLDRLQQAGVAILRTDQSGAIHIATDGKRFEVACFVPCPTAAEALNSGVQANAPNHQQNHEQQ